jgi:Ca2+:H+ antiporter
MNHPFSLVCTLFELVTIFLAAIILNLIARDGTSNWFEGIMVTFVYIIIAVGYVFRTRLINLYNVLLII